ncbi:MAG: DNA adenine methylase [Lachnospiraceae bacterium]|nr:DNA adenine methylase [Lachnospiraceae bacterium]
MKTVLMYPGAKNRIANWIISYMPTHDVYLELFSGSAAVLLNKARCHIETLNDVDGDIVNFFSVLRDYPEELCRLIDFTPFARDEYNNAFDWTDDPIERARRYCVKCWQGFGNSQLYKNGFKSGQQRKSPNPAGKWLELPEIMKEAADRLKGVQIENLPAIELLKRYDTADVFIYADPPYLTSTRKNYLYKHEMTFEDHIELLDVLKTHPGAVMISGYDNDLYNKCLSGWRKAYKDTNAECGIKRTEVLWMNYDDVQLSLFDNYKEYQ